MKFKKSLFLTFCLLSGAIQTTHPISWNDIKNGVRYRTNTALMQLAEINPSLKG